MLIINGVNCFLPGVYGPTYEMCTCRPQDYTLPSKFDNTNAVLVFVTVMVYVFVSVRIKFYKNKSNPQENQTETRKFARNKFIADLTLTIGPVLLIIIINIVNYTLGKSRSNISDKQYPYHIIIQLQFLIAIPLTINIFVILFYLKNKEAKRVLLREWNNKQPS